MPISSKYIPEEMDAGECDECEEHKEEGERQPYWKPGGGVLFLCKTPCYQEIVKYYNPDSE